jgi:hypothetical protein
MLLLVEFLMKFMATEYISFSDNVYSSEFIHSLTHPLNENLSDCYAYAVVLSTMRQK